MHRGAPVAGSGLAVYEEAALGQNAAVLRRDGLYQLRSGNEPRRALVSPAPAWPPRYAGGTVASWNTWFNVRGDKPQLPGLGRIGHG